MNQETPVKPLEQETSPASETPPEITPPIPPKGKMAIRLKKPILVENEPTHYLIVPERLLLKDLQVTDRAKGDIERTTLLIAHAAKIPLVCAEHIDVADIQEGSELFEYIKSFL